MKILCLKLDDDVYEEMKKMASKLKLARNQYINDAVIMYNLFNKRRILKNQLEKESAMTRKESMKVLREFENLISES